MGMNEADRELTQRVSETFRQDDTLGAAAQNITVLASNGTVTLRGSVDSEEKKNNLAEKAQEVAGVTQVNNELEVSGASRQRQSEMTTEADRMRGSSSGDTGTSGKSWGSTAEPSPSSSSSSSSSAGR